MIPFTTSSGSSATIGSAETYGIKLRRAAVVSDAALLAQGADSEPNTTVVAGITAVQYKHQRIANLFCPWPGETQRSVQLSYRSFTDATCQYATRDRVFWCDSAVSVTIKAGRT